MWLRSANGRTARRYDPPVSICAVPAPAPRLPGSIARRQGLAHVLDTVRPQYKGPAPVLMSDDFDRARRRREIDGDRRGG